MDPFQAELDRLRQRDLQLQAEMTLTAAGICRQLETEPHRGLARFPVIGQSVGVAAALRLELERSEQLAPHQRHALLTELNQIADTDEVSWRAVGLALLWAGVIVLAVIVLVGYLA